MENPDPSKYTLPSSFKSVRQPIVTTFSNRNLKIKVDDIHNLKGSTKSSILSKRSGKSTDRN